MRLSVNMRGLDGCLSCSIDWFFVKLNYRVSSVIICLVHSHLCILLRLSWCLRLWMLFAGKISQNSLKKVTWVCLRGTHFNTVYIKGFIISVQKTHLYLTFFTRRRMWFSFSSRIFLKVSTSLWFSKSSLWRRWLFSSRVSQTACTQDNSQHVT